MARKSVDDLINRFSPEEWRRIIEEEMDKLGLCFGELQEEYLPLFPEEKPDEVHSFNISFSARFINDEQYAVSNCKPHECYESLINTSTVISSPVSGSLTAA